MAERPVRPYNSGKKLKFSFGFWLLLHKRAFKITGKNSNICNCPLVFIPLSTIPPPISPFHGQSFDIFLLLRSSLWGTTLRDKNPLSCRTAPQSNNSNNPLYVVVVDRYAYHRWVCEGALWLPLADLPNSQLSHNMEQEPHPSNSHYCIASQVPNTRLACLWLSHWAIHML